MSESKRSRVRKAVIPIAGFGTRMFPSSKAIPKAFFPVLDLDGFCKPVLQVIIEEALSAMGDDGQVCIVVAPGQQEAIEKYFQGHTDEAYHKKPELKEQIARLQYIGKRLYFAEQTTAQGFGHAVLAAREFVGDELFLVLLGDHIYLSSHPQRKTCTQQLLDVFEKTGRCCTTMDTCEEAVVSVNGLMKGNPVEPGSIVYDLLTSAEKPSSSFAKDKLQSPGLPAGRYFCNFGIDLLPPRVFEILQYNFDNNIRTKGELQLRDAMKTLIENRDPAHLAATLKQIPTRSACKVVPGLFGLFVPGRRCDTGQPDMYAQTIGLYDQRIKEVASGSAASGAGAATAASGSCKPQGKCCSSCGGAAGVVGCSSSSQADCVKSHLIAAAVLGAAVVGWFAWSRRS